MSGRKPVSKEQYPNYTLKDRKKIATLVNHLDWLGTQIPEKPWVDKETRAFVWVLEYLEFNDTPVVEEHVDILKSFCDYWSSDAKRPLNGFQIEELGAVKWALREVEDAGLPGM